MNRTATLLLAVLAAGLCAGRASANPATLGSIPRASTVYTSQQVDALLGSVTVQPDPELVTNLVAESSAQILNAAPDSAAWTALRLVVADLWKRVDLLDGADGTGYVTSNAVEALVAGRVASEIAVERDTWVATNSLVQNTALAEISTGTQSGVSVALDPNRAVRYYANYAGERSLGIGSFSGVGTHPCILILQGYSSVSWPSGAKVKTAYAYSSGADNYFRVYRLHGAIVVERIYP